MFQRIPRFESPAWRVGLKPWRRLEGTVICDWHGVEHSYQSKELRTQHSASSLTTIRVLSFIPTSGKRGRNWSHWTNREREREQDREWERSILPENRGNRNEKKNSPVIFILYFSFFIKKRYFWVKRATFDMEDNIYKNPSQNWWGGQESLFYPFNYILIANQ